MTNFCDIVIVVRRLKAAMDVAGVFLLMLKAFVRELLVCL